MNSILFPALTVPVLVIFLSACTGFNTVKVTQQSETGANVYRLQTEYNAPVSFSSNALVEQANETCPSGYEVLSQQATKPAEFAQEDASCAAGKNCHYQLEWRIQCVEKPKEEASIFGKI